MTRFCPLVIICLALVGCKDCNDEPPPPSVLVLVDFSTSARTLLPDYKRYLLEIVSKVPPGGQIVVGKIQRATVAHFDPFVNERIIGKPGLLDVQKDIEDQQRSQRERIQRVIDSVFSDPVYSPGTSILAGLSLVKEVLPFSKWRVLVLLSDMFHASEDLNLETARVNEGFIEQTISRLKNRGDIADLNGVSIYVAGATARTDDEYKLIKRFWERVFQEAGGTLKSYGRPLVNFSF